MSAPTAMRMCRAALALAPLVAVTPRGSITTGRTHFAYRQRLFSCRTVNALIANGEARRDGDLVVKI